MLHLTAKNFQIEVKDTSLPVVVMFYAIWCGKCAMMKPVVEDIEKKYAGKIKKITVICLEFYLSVLDKHLVVTCKKIQ